MIQEQATREWSIRVTFVTRANTTREQAEAYASGIRKAGEAYAHIDHAYECEVYDLDEMVE